MELVQTKLIETELVGTELIAKLIAELEIRARIQQLKELKILLIAVRY